jgi:hypothetical protein
MRTIGSETVGRHMPALATPDDVAATIAADEHHRYA